MPEPRVLDTPLEGVLLVEPSPIADERGFFVRTMAAEVLAAAGIDATAVVHENQSRSRMGTLRGLHMRTALAEGKFVRCARGAIYEVVVDLRPWSSTSGRWTSFELDDVAHRQVFVPPGCAHGFFVRSDWADVCYKHDAVYDPGVEGSLAWDDPVLAIPWPSREPLLSERDRTAPDLASIRPLLATWYGTERPSAPAGGTHRSFQVRQGGSPESQS